MSSFESESRQSRYSDLVNQQIIRTASAADSIRPPRPLTDDEITASLAPNFEYYLGIQQQRANRFRVNPEILTLEQKKAHFTTVFANIAGAVNRRFSEVTEDTSPVGVVALELPMQEFDLAEVIPLFPVPAEQAVSFAEVG